MTEEFRVVQYKDGLHGIRLVQKEGNHTRFAPDYLQPKESSLYLLQIEYLEAWSKPIIKEVDFEEIEE